MKKRLITTIRRRSSSVKLLIVRRKLRYLMRSGQLFLLRASPTKLWNITARRLRFSTPSEVSGVRPSSSWISARITIVQHSLTMRSRPLRRRFHYFAVSATRATQRHHWRVLLELRWNAGISRRLANALKNRWRWERPFVLDPVVSSCAPLIALR